MCKGDHNLLRPADHLPDLESRLERIIDEKINEQRQETNERLAKREEEKFEKDYEDVYSLVTNEVYGMLVEPIKHLERRMEEIKDRLEERIDRIDLFRPKVDYTFKFENLQRLFQLENDFLSSFFWCRGTKFVLRTGEMRQIESKD